MARAPLHPAEPAGHSRRRRRRRFGLPFRVVPVGLALLTAGWLAWASTTEGGVPERLGDAVEAVRGKVEGATADPGARRAAEYFNRRYGSDGAYPELSEAQLSRDEDIDWGIGVGVDWCGPRAVVLTSLTGSGTVSRLLLDGHDIGSVSGRHGCPANLADPSPWTTAETE